MIKVADDTLKNATRDYLAGKIDASELGRIIRKLAQKQAGALVEKAKRKSPEMAS